MELLLEKFKLNNKCQLNSEDISSLSLLYLPLIGIDSFSLYTTLSSLNKNEEYYIKKLINITNSPTLKELTSAFDKLEGIGLLKTYYHKDKGYVFDVLNPLNEKEFLKEEALVTLLETQVGPTEIENLRNRNKDITKGYKEITKKLSDVYTVSIKQKSNVISNLIKPNIIIENNDFNYSLFKMLFDSTFMDEEVLNEESFKTMIIKISFIYKLNEDEMKDIVFNSINNDKRCDYASLSKYARITFQKKYKVDTPKLVTVKEDQYIQSVEDDVVLKLCNDLESSSPSEILEQMSGMKPTPSELKLCEDLCANTKLTIGAINFMLMYVSKEKNGELPSYNYFEKIASTWSRAKVKTAYDAIKYTEKKNSEKQEPKQPSRSKKQAVVPDWYKGYEESLNNENKNTTVNKEIEEIAKNLFED